MDRDINAAINIRDFAIFRNLRKSISNTDGRSEINAFGVGSAGNCDASCDCETTDDELGKFSGIKSENGNHL